MFTLNLPSKTFLLGEYLVLHDGPALVLNTEPCFQLQCAPGNSALNNIHPQSPAGKFYSAHQDLFTDWQLTFTDPHQNKGGLGASSAQFAALYLLQKLFSGNIRQPQQTDINIFMQTLNIPHLLKTYQKYAWDQQGYPPSGADVVSQLYGGITYFAKSENMIESLVWPFQDLSFCLLRTGKKLATHEHLTSLNNLETETLDQIVQQGSIALVQANANAFCAAINAYAEALQVQNLVAEHTQQILNDLQHWPEVKAVKGCGALGADIVLAICAGDTKALKEKFRTANYDVVTCSQAATLGINIDEA